MDSLLLTCQDGQEVICPPSLLRHSTLLTTTSSYITETIEPVPIPFEKDSLLHLFQILQEHDSLPFPTPRVKLTLFDGLPIPKLMNLLTLANFLDIQCLVDPLTYILASKKREGWLLEEEYEDIYRKCYDKLDHYASQVTLPYTLYDYMKEKNQFSFSPDNIKEVHLFELYEFSLDDSIRELEKDSTNGMVLDSRGVESVKFQIKVVNEEICRDGSINLRKCNLCNLTGFGQDKRSLSRLEPKGSNQMHITYHSVTLDISDNKISTFLDINGQNCFSSSSEAVKIVTLILSHNEGLDWNQLDPLSNLKHLMICNGMKSDERDAIEKYADKRDIWLFYREEGGEQYKWRIPPSVRANIVFNLPANHRGERGPKGNRGPRGNIGYRGEWRPLLVL